MSTTRRSFFRSLGLLAGAASVSPTIFIPKFEPVRWKVLRCEDYTEVIYHPRDLTRRWKAIRPTECAWSDYCVNRGFVGDWDIVIDGPPLSFYQMCVRGWRLEEKAGRKLTYGEWESGVLGKQLEI